MQRETRYPPPRLSSVDGAGALEWPGAAGSPGRSGSAAQSTDPWSKEAQRSVVVAAAVAVAVAAAAVVAIVPAAEPA